MASRYHQVPRDSIDSDRDDAHEYLIPSPHNEVVEDVSSPPKVRGFSINVRIANRIFSCMCSLIGFLLMILVGGQTFIPSAVFMMLTLIFNIYMLLYASVTNFVTFSIFYQDRDLLDFGAGTFTRPNLSSYLDLLAGVGIFIPLTIAVAENHHVGSPVAPAIFGYFVIATQAVLAIPALDSVKFTIRRVSGGAKAKHSYGIHRADRKISLMVGAIDADAVETNETTAIPPPLVESEPSVEVATDLV